MLYIRTDANEEIASGHVMRCITIAKAVKKRGLNCIFITADREAKKLITDNGFSTICLDTVWNQMEDELEKLLEVIRTENISWLLVDSYSVTEKYLKKLNENTNVIYMDDINRLFCSVDGLINYNIYSEDCGYEVKYKESETTLLLGCRYIPLREEFCNIQLHIRDTITDILITTGGADKENVAVGLLCYLETHNLFQSLHFHVVSGGFNTNLVELKELELQYENITIYQNVSSMSKLMSKCDLSISAGGTTLYELCACGIPTICFATADNQLDTVKAFAQKDIMFYAGDVRRDKLLCFHKIKESIKYCQENMSLRRKKASMMQMLVDGKGADRIAEFILEREE